MNISFLTLVFASCVALAQCQKKILLIGQTNGDIQIQTAGPRYNLSSTVKKAHGCDSSNYCWVTYINQLSSNYSSYVVTSGDDSLIKIWKIDNSVSLKPICTLSGHTDWVYQTLEVDSVPDMLASASKDGTIRLWSIKSCTFLKSFEVGAEVRALENYPGGEFIVSGDVSGGVLKWNIISNESTIYAQLPYKINDIWLLGSNNEYLGVATSNNCNGDCSVPPFYDKGSLWLLNVTNSGLVFNDDTTYTDILVFVYGDTSIDDSTSLDFLTDSTDAHSDSVRAISPISADQFATASADGKTKVWSISNKNLVKSYDCHTREIRYALDNLKVTYNTSILIDGSFDNNIHAYSIPTQIESNPLLGAYTTGQSVSALSIVNESNGRVQAFVGLICAALLLTRSF